MKRIGLIGCGTVADYGHLPAIKEVPGFQLHAVFDINLKRARETAAKFGVPHAYDDLDAFFKSGIDVATITSPAVAHRANVLAAAKAGVHVMCEKPLASNDAEALEMIEAMKLADRHLFTCYCYRYSPVAMTIRKLIREGAIGTVGSLRLIYLWDFHGKWERSHFEDRKILARRDAMMRENGSFPDCGSHQIDLALWWTGSEVVRVTGHGAWNDSYQQPDHAWAHLDHANGVHSMIEIGASYGHTSKDPVSYFVYEIIGSDGIIRYDRNNHFFEIRTAAGTTQLPYAHEKDFTGQYVALSKALETGDLSEMCTGEGGQIVNRIACEAMEQAMAKRGK